LVALSKWEDDGNVHGPSGAALRPRPYHLKIAALAAERLPEGGTLLDLGCGAGLGVAAVKALRPDVRYFIADAYQDCLDETATRLGGAEGTYLLNDAGFDPGAVIRDRFDVVLMSHVLEHLMDPVTGLGRALGLAAPGGALILATPNPGRPELLVSNLLRRHYVNRGHVCAWDPSHWRNFLERIMGLNVEAYAADAVSFGPGAAGRWLTDRLGPACARIAPWWAFSNIAVVRAPEN